MSKLIIPDIHNQIDKVDQILSLEEDNYDGVIALGDFFDDFHDTLEITKETATWLKEKISNSSWQICCGNHDFAYKYPWNPNAYCSGFTEEKSKIIREVLCQNDFRTLKSFHIENGILYSHAGIDYWFLDMIAQYGTIEIKDKYSLDELDDLLRVLVQQADNFYSVGHAHPLYKAGYNRGGDQSNGGLIWQDFSSHRVLDGIKSICGHTPCKAPTFKYFDKNKLVNVNPHGDEEINLPQQYYCFADQHISDFNKIDLLLKNGFTLDLDTHLEYYAKIEYIDININRLKVYKINFDKVFDNKNPKEKRIILGNSLVFDRII